MGGAALSRVQRNNVPIRQSFDHNKFQVERFLFPTLIGRFRIVATVELASEDAQPGARSGVCWAARRGVRPRVALTATFAHPGKTFRPNVGTIPSKAGRSRFAALRLDF